MHFSSITAICISLLACYAKVKTTPAPQTVRTPLPTTGCDRGATMISGKCLTFSKEAKNWHDAKSSCSKDGGTLVTLEDSTDAAAVLDFVVKTFGSGTVEFWAGGNDIETEGTWNWINGGGPFLPDFPWCPDPKNQPDDGYGGQDCLIINWKGCYDDQQCPLHHRYICEYREALSCEDHGGVKIANQCLIFHDEALTATEAATQCASKGTQLASLTDPTAVMIYKNKIYGGTSVWVNNVNDVNRGTYFWVGGSDAKNEGTWTWPNGKPFGNSFPWGEGEPNDLKGEDCVMTWHGATYNDVACSYKFRAICELVKTTPAPPTIRTPLPTTGSCPNLFELVGGECYFMSWKHHNNKTSWLGARHLCQELGAELNETIDLAELEDGHDNADSLILVEIAAHGKNKNSGWTWLGATDDAIEGDWIWSLSKRQLELSDLFWGHNIFNNDNEPDGGRGENCLMSNRAQLSDRSCGAELDFICQIL